ncbi:hypothetical protein GP486_001036 [Trichoglossum hirsutum]|uniref:Uncharacterized protein n=1 Tax=Trichoglossum hirsutum TaxID=265104 RepID=A0A9P8LHT6_9PEZI|nr:hypothetical protein GP486_001036 [Trichoglossum hirsutum]
MADNPSVLRTIISPASQNGVASPQPPSPTLGNATISEEDTQSYVFPDERISSVQDSQELPLILEGVIRAVKIIEKAFAHAGGEPPLTLEEVIRAVGIIEKAFVDARREYKVGKKALGVMSTFFQQQINKQEAISKMIEVVNAFELASEKFEFGIRGFVVVRSFYEQQLPGHADLQHDAKLDFLEAAGAFQKGLEDLETVRSFLQQLIPGFLNLQCGNSFEFGEKTLQDAVKAFKQGELFFGNGESAFRSMGSLLQGQRKSGEFGFVDSQLNQPPRESSKSLDVWPSVLVPLPSTDSSAPGGHRKSIGNTPRPVPTASLQPQQTDLFLADKPRCNCMDFTAGPSQTRSHLK